MTRPLDEQIATLNQAIAAQEGLRSSLGDTIVDAAIAALRRQLAELEAQSVLAEQQRKQATVLLADVSGFTAMSETMDVEDVGDTMNALWRRIDAVIVSHGGRIDKHIGDAVMALWGVDQAREDDPERAVRAALAMQAALVAFRDEYPVRLRMRIGINTGPVLLGGVGTTGEVSAIGDAVNLASRLQHAAPVGGVLISYDTYRQVRGLFDVLPQEPLIVRGKSEPVRSFVVQRAKPRAFHMGTRGVEGIRTRMVGRDAELLTLQNAFLDAVEGAGTRVVTVVGDAGVGKSRLLYEFERWIESLPYSVHYFKGRATPEMLQTPYSIVRDAFAHRFDIRESDSAMTVLTKFRAGMEGILAPDQADLVGHMVGFDFLCAGSQAVSDLLGSPSFSRLAIAYLVGYVRAVAREPTVLFLDDVHWADDRALDLVDHLAAQVPGARMLIICLARPQLFERHRTWGQGEAHTRLQIGLLSEDDSRVLVDEILHKATNVPDALRDLVVGGAEGNPFYVEELIKMLIDDGVIVRGENGEDPWRIMMERLTEVRVPATLTGVLQARLDGLPRDEKEVLQRASVVGRSFWDATVGALAPDDAPDDVEPGRIPALLEALQDRELVFERDHSAFESTNEYIFKHAILRDVAYEMVLLRLRRVYHAQVARWLEAHAGDRLGEYLGLIAQHYESAGEEAQAADYLRRSGEDRYRMSAYSDAIAAFERALALLSAAEREVDVRATIHVRLGYAYRQTSDYPLATQHLEQGLALAQEPSRGNRQTEVAALNGLGWTALVQGSSEAVSYLEQALTLAREIDDREGLSVVLYNLGEVAFRQGNSEDAERYARESLAICEELGDRQGMAFALRVLGFAAHLRGEYAEAARYHEASQTKYREVGDRWGVATGFVNRGEATRMQGKYEEAAGYYEASLPTFEEIGNRVGIAIASLNLAHVHARMDHDDIARRHLHRALAESLAIGSLGIGLETLAVIALVWAKAGRHEQAAELLGLVQAHPAFNEEIRVNAEPAFAILREALTAEALAAALAQGQELDLETVGAEILAMEKGVH